MRITSVELHPENSSSVCVLSFRDPGRQNPYNVRSIAGLDAEDIVPRFYGGPGNSVKFYNLSLEKREPVVSIELNPRISEDESYSSLRDDLYRLIASSRTGLVEMQFKDGATVVAAISGFVTKFEASHFEKNPGVQLTLRCDDPMLRAPDPVSVVVAGLNPASTNIQDDLSTAPHGFKFELEFLANLASFNLEDPLDPNWNFTVTPIGGFLDNDILHFSSEYNDKYLYIIRGATTIHLADVIISGSVWPILFPGPNNFTITSPTSVQWNLIEYHPTYWGV